MITDYSSVAFDFNYLKKPVIFFHFDLDDYLSHRGSYINLRKDLIGDIATTKEDVINFIKYYLEKNFVPNPKNLIKSTKYYEFHDRNNAKRIYDEIKKVSKNNG
jgi:CDP-glycerol glycerophosphotransferase (TagB/SpsB family)